MRKPFSKRTKNWAKPCGDSTCVRWKRRTCFRRADGKRPSRVFLLGARTQHADPAKKTWSQRVNIGMLAVQGDYEAHAAMLERLGAERVEVRTPAQPEGR